MADSFIDGIQSLPLEVIRKIISYLKPYEVVDKLIEPNSWCNLSPIQNLALELTFTKKMIIRRNLTNDWNCLVIDGFEKGYKILHKLISYNLQTSKVMFPREIELILSFRGDSHADKVVYNNNLYREIESFIKLLEILSFDNFKDHQLCVDSEMEEVVPRTYSKSSCHLKGSEMQLESSKVSPLHDTSKVFEILSPLGVSENGTPNFAINDLDNSEVHQNFDNDKKDYQPVLDGTSYTRFNLESCNISNNVFENSPNISVDSSNGSAQVNDTNLANGTFHLANSSIPSRSKPPSNSSSSAAFSPTRTLPKPFINRFIPEQTPYTFQLLYPHPPTPIILNYTKKIIQRLENLSQNIVKLLIQCRHSTNELSQNLNILSYPFLSSNLRELYLWNNGVREYTLKQYLKRSPVFLTILDLTANEISSLEGINLPSTLEVFIISANNVISLEGPNYDEAVNLKVLDASVNAITNLNPIRFPPSLTTLRLSYNTICNIDLVLPQNLQILNLSKNLLDSIDHIFLPDSLEELYLKENSFKSFETDYFAGNFNLRLIDLSENKIDDLDDLGTLPDSLEELILDNNEIDYSDLNNIFTKNLLKLSMISTGLISLNDLKFPENLRELNLSKNEISEIRNVRFGGETGDELGTDLRRESDVTNARNDPDSKESPPAALCSKVFPSTNLLELNLSGNKLTQFNLPNDNLQLASGLNSLNLSDNLFINGLDDISLPSSLKCLYLSNIRVDNLDNAFIQRLPLTLEVLELNSILSSPEGAHGIELTVDFASFLPNLQHLSLERNHIVLIKDVTYPQNLTWLSYEYNELSIIPFERIPTNIKHLQFNYNRISEQVKLEALRYFPKIEYFGLNGDQRMKEGVYFGSPDMWSTI
jgi:Leucine-rich repeat (LRR) protein